MWCLFTFSDVVLVTLPVRSFIFGALDVVLILACLTVIGLPAIYGMYVDI